MNWADVICAWADADGAEGLPVELVVPDAGVVKPETGATIPNLLDR
jgi:hypothetical protein